MYAYSTHIATDPTQRGRGAPDAFEARDYCDDWYFVESRLYDGRRGLSSVEPIVDTVEWAALGGGVE